MALAFDATSTSGATGTSLSWSHTCTGNNRFLVVGLSSRSALGSPAVTYAGVAMTLHDSQTGATGGNAYWYYLAAPASGSNTVSVTWTGSTDCRGGAVSFTGAKSTPGTAAKTTSAGTSISIDVTSATGEIVVDVLSIAGGSTTATAGAGQTERWNALTGSPGVKGSGSTEAGAATTTMSWSTITGGSNAAIVAAAVKPSQLLGTATISGAMTATMTVSEYPVWSATVPKNTWSITAADIGEG